MEWNDNPGCLPAIQRFFRPKQRDKYADLEDYGEFEAHTSAGVEFERYRVVKSFFHPSELEFYKVLKVVVGEKNIILSQVGMGGLFSVSRRYEKGWQALQNKIERKRLDFLLCDPASMQPVLGIELDGSSHRRTSRISRDKDIEQIFKAASLPLIRQAVRVTYKHRQVADSIINKLR